MSSLLHPYSPSQWRQLRSASLNLLSQPRINITLASRGFRHAGPSLPHHLSSTDSYSLQIQSKNSPVPWCKYLWPLAISIRALLIRYNHVDFASWNYISPMLCYVMLCYAKHGCDGSFQNVGVNLLSECCMARCTFWRQTFTYSWTIVGFYDQWEIVFIEFLQLFTLVKITYFKIFGFQCFANETDHNGFVCMVF